MKKWKYEAGTKTIRSIPENYWIATMDSCDRAVDNQENAKLIAAAPELLETLKALSLAVKPVIFKAGVKRAYSEIVAIAAADKLIENLVNQKQEKKNENE